MAREGAHKMWYMNVNLIPLVVHQMHYDYDNNLPYLTPLPRMMYNPIYSNRQHVIAFDLYGKGNKQCLKKREGTYIMDVGQFALAYTAQKQIDYSLMGNDYGGADALDYVACTAVEYNDIYVSHMRALIIYHVYSLGMKT